MASPIVDALEVTYSGAQEPWRVSVPAEAVADLLRPWDGRRRAFLVSLLNGYSKGMAAASSSVTVRCVQKWAAKEAAFREAVELAERVGFATVLEAELYKRAMAGPEDRGSMRALELVVKSREANYREKAQVQLAVVAQAREAMVRFVEGWESEVAGPRE